MTDTATPARFSYPFTITVAVVVTLFVLVMNAVTAADFVQHCVAELGLTDAECQREHAIQLVVLPAIGGVVGGAAGFAIDYGREWYREWRRERDAG